VNVRSSALGGSVVNVSVDTKLTAFRQECAHGIEVDVVISQVRHEFEAIRNGSAHIEAVCCEEYPSRDPRDALFPSTKVWF
jgi:hypothetical protein